MVAVKIRCKDLDKIGRGVGETGLMIIMCSLFWTTIRPNLIAAENILTSHLISLPICEGFASFSIEVFSDLQIFRTVPQEMKFVVLEQKYLEHLEAGRALDALHVLRNELTPLQFDTARVHRLSALMMCADPHELRARAAWAGGAARAGVSVILSAEGTSQQPESCVLVLLVSEQLIIVHRRLRLLLSCVMISSEKESHQVASKNRSRAAPGVSVGCLL